MWPWSRYHDLNGDWKDNYLEENKKLKQKYRNKKCSARKEKIPMFLSFQEYCLLAKEASIIADDIGINKYHLARYNDEGAYEYGNCRFIHYLENIKEKENKGCGTLVAKDKSGNVFKVPIDDYRLTNGDLQFLWCDRKHKESSKKLIGEKNAILQKGEGNSQYGTCWIYHPKDKLNIKINKNDIEFWLQQGWSKGRKMKF